MKTTLVTINGKTYRKAVLTGDQFCDCNVSTCTLCMFNNSNGCNAETSEYDCSNGWFIEEENQPPTKEQLVKAFKIFYSDKVVQEDIISKESDFVPIVEQILEHWNDEEDVKKEKY